MYLATPSDVWCASELGTPVQDVVSIIRSSAVPPSNITSSGLMSPPARPALYVDLSARETTAKCQSRNNKERGRGEKTWAIEQICFESLKRAGSEKKALHPSGVSSNDEHALEYVGHFLERCGM
jgi:hypothetical protein